MSATNKYKISMVVFFDIKNEENNTFSLIAKAKYNFIHEGIEYSLSSNTNIYKNVSLDEIDKALEEGKLDSILQNIGYTLVKEKMSQITFKREHILNKLSNKAICYTYEVDEAKETMTIVEEDE